MQRTWWVGVVVVMVTACAERPAPPAQLTAVVSVLPQAYFVDKLAGGLVKVEVMIPPGASPHSYEPSMAQMTSVSRADLYVEVGHPHFAFEQAWLNKLLAGRADLLVVDASAHVERKEEDPHVWVAPSNVRAMARDIAAALDELLPQQHDTLQANLDRCLAEIDMVDTDIRQTLSGVEGRKFYVFHPAWGYFADEYHLQQVAIEHEGKEPDPKELATVIEHARADGTTVIFAQPQFDPASANAIAQEIGARVDVIDPLAYDWSGNLREVARKLAAAMSRP